jgi:hypothetical protein
LREGRVSLPLVEGQSTYTIPSDVDDLLKIQSINGTLREQEYQIPLNVKNDWMAIHTPEYNRLTVPTDPEKAVWLSETSILEIVYRADHPEIDKYVANAAPLTTEIHLPSTGAP